MGINKDTPEMQFYLAYYLDEGDMNNKKTAVIPIRLKEKFLERFKDNPTPNKIEIFNFLDNNE